MTININCKNEFELSLMTPTSFQLAFLKIPHIAFMCQHVNIPDVSFGTALAAYQNHDLRLPGEKLTFGMLNAQILLDKNFVTYKEIFKWMKDISVLEFSNDWTSTATLIINEEESFVFHDIYPINIGQIDLYNQTNDSPAVTFSVVFNYNYFDIAK